MHHGHLQGGAFQIVGDLFLHWRERSRLHLKGVIAHANVGNEPPLLAHANLVLARVLRKIALDDLMLPFFRQRSDAVGSLLASLTHRGVTDPRKPSGARVGRETVGEDHVATPANWLW